MSDCLQSAARLQRASLLSPLSRLDGRRLLPLPANRLVVWCALVASGAGLVLLSLQHAPALAAAFHGPAWAYALGVAAGLAAGFLFGLLGIGGALVVLPALYLMLPALGVAPEALAQVAVATSLVSMLPGALRGTCLQYRCGGLDRAWLRRMLPGVIGGAACGALLATVLDGRIVGLLFVVQSAYYGWGLVRTVPASPRGTRACLARAAKRLPVWLMAPTSGAFCGCAGMGGGSFVTPYLAAQGLPLPRAAATSGAINVGIAAGGGLVFAVLAALPGHGATVCLPAAVVIALALLAAAPLGVRTAPRLPLQTFRRALGGINLLGAAVLLARMV